MSEYVTESLTELFHLVKSLIPENQEIEPVRPRTRVADAVKVMLENKYSQLPVVESGVVLGVFSLIHTHRVTYEAKHGFLWGIARG